MLGNIVSFITIRQTRVHHMVYPLSTTSIEMSMIFSPKHRFRLQLILSSVTYYLSHVLKTEATMNPRKTNFLEIIS